MKLSGLFFGCVIIGILLCSGLYLNINTYHNAWLKDGMKNTFIKSESFVIIPYSVKSMSVGIKSKNQQINKKLSSAPLWPNLQALSLDKDTPLPISAKNILAKNIDISNMIIPISAGSFDGKSSDTSVANNAFGMGSGGGGSTIPIAGSVNRNSNSTIVYISVNGNSNVISCNIVKSFYNTANTNGASNNSGEIPTGVTNCNTVLSGTNGLNGPDNLLIMNNHLYVVNSGNNGVTSCGLSSNGSINSCNSFGVPTSYPIYIMRASTQQLYVYGFPSETGVVKVDNCVTDNSGNIIDCSNNSFNANVSQLPYPIIGGYSYTTNYSSGGINKCTAELKCQLLNNILIPASNGPTAVEATSNNVYIVNENSLVGCGIDKNSGNFFNCSILSNNLNGAEGIAIYHVSNS